MNRNEEPGNGLRKIAFTLVPIGFLAIGGYFLWTEHRAHVATAIPYLPFILLAACGVMHLFHGGHGGHRRDQPNHDKTERDPDGGRS